MARRMRDFDWASSAVGPPSAWPESLKMVVRLALNSRYPMFVWWGAGTLTYFYNDAYIPVLGAKHPGALGRCGATVWTEIWDTLGPIVDAVFKESRANWSEELPLVMERHGYREETFFTFSYSAIVETDGSVAGLFCACTEDTKRMVAERRLRTQRALAGEVASARDVEEASAKAAHCLGTNPDDVPFALIYLLNDDGTVARLASCAGVGDDAALVARDISVGDATDVWNLARVARTRESAIISGFERAFVGAVPRGTWDQVPTHALVVPLSRPGYSVLAGFVVFGLSPRRAFDDDYRGFYELLAGHIATGLMNARAHEEERKRAKALAELDRAKTAFFSNISHEFRTPLTLMLGPLEDVLAMPDLSELEHQQLSVAHRNSLRLLKLVNTLLDFSRIEAGRIEAAYEETDVCTYTGELASVFRSAIERAGLSFEVTCVPVSSPVFLDREMWEKIVLNLLSNAFKFTLSGGIFVTVREQGPNVTMTVRDTGMGIPAHELPNIFKRFHRVKGAHGRTHEGTGIGLALVQELVKLHGGRVTVESEMGRGTTFTVTVPTGSAHLPPERVREEGTSFPSSHGKAYAEEALQWLSGSEDHHPRADAPLERTHVSRAGARVLVADDNQDMRKYLARLLSQFWTVETAADGEAALAAIGNTRPDLVLADVTMPKLDGFGLLRAIRDDPSTRTLPVIMLSARAGEEARVEGLEAGADDYLVKPFSARELIARVNAHLELARVRREAEAAVRESEERFRHMADNAPVMVWTTEPDGRCSFLSKSWYEFTGQTPATGLGFGWLEAIHPDDRADSEAMFRAANQRPAPFRLDYRLRGADGRYRWAIDSAVPRFGRDGEFRGYIGSVLDITERKRAEEELALVSNSVPALIALVGSDFRYRFCNRTYAEWFEIAPQDIVGRTVREVLGDQVWQNVEPHMRAALTGQTVEFETEARYLRGATRWIHAVYTPQRDEHGTVVGLVAMVSDVTARRRIEEALREADERKDEFLAMLAHELRNPLAPIQNACRILGLLGLREPRLVQARDIIERQTHHLTRLVDDLLDVSRITRGKITLQREPIDIETVVRAAVEVARPAIDRLGHSLTVSHTKQPARLEGDFARLVQVVSNLLGNAAKFTPAGGRITLTTQQTEGKVVLRVRDSGVGMEPELQDKVFDLFVQEETGLARTQGGLGIGLTLVKRIVELHSGTVDVKSEGTGRGSELTITLPALPPTRAIPPSPTREPRLAAGSNPLRILLVEDNPDAAESLMVLLQLGGHDVRVAHDGHTALQVVEDFSPDIAFIDVGLPGIDGYELAPRLRAHPRCHSSVLVALTGYGREEDKRRAAHAGFDHHLTKPVDFDAIDRLLTNVSHAAGAVQDPRAPSQ